MVIIKLTYRLTGFDPLTGFKNKTDELEITWPEIYHAGITLGRKSIDDVLFHPLHSLQEMYFRYYMMTAFLSESHNHIGISPAYKTLDPSEKGAINYFNGGVFSSVFAKRLFDTPWIMHLDVYKKGLYNSRNIKITYSTKGIRPDFIGVNTLGEFNVFESKGRVSFSNKSLNKAYNQSKNILTINGKLPEWKLGYVISHNNNNYRVVIKDPEESNKDAMHLKIDMKEFYQNYYLQIYHYLDVKGFDIIEESGINFVVSKRDCYDFVLGLDKNIFMAYGEGQNSLLAERIQENILENEIYKNEIEGFNAKNKDIYIGKDGVIVKLFN